MFVEELQRAVQAAPRHDLPRLSAVLWRAYSAGAIGEGEAQGLSEAIEARKSLPPSAKSATGRRCGSKPRSSESTERRRRWVASGKLPPQLAAQFTQGEAAVLSVVAVEVQKSGSCSLTIGHLAALAGVCPTTARNALREAKRLGLLAMEERRVSAFRNLPNVLRITSVQWRSWLRLGAGQGGGCKTVNPTSTDSYNFAAKRPSSGFKGLANKAWTGKSASLAWNRPATAVSAERKPVYNLVRMGLFE